MHHPSVVNSSPSPFLQYEWPIIIRSPGDYRNGFDLLCHCDGCHGPDSLPPTFRDDLRIDGRICYGNRRDWSHPVRHDRRSLGCPDVSKSHCSSSFYCLSTESFLTFTEGKTYMIGWGKKGGYLIRYIFSSYKFIHKFIREVETYDYHSCDRWSGFYRFPSFW